ncbi:MAG: hypothetical protein ACREEW_07485 [Caulobacteraceae bacterium]
MSARAPQSWRGRRASNLRCAGAADAGPSPAALPERFMPRQVEQLQARLDEAHAEHLDRQARERAAYARGYADGRAARRRAHVVEWGAARWSWTDVAVVAAMGAVVVLCWLAGRHG